VKSLILNSLNRNIKVIFLDRDGTIIKDDGFTHKIKDLAFISNAIEGLIKMRNLGYQLNIVTNQSGVGRGIFSETDYFSFNNYFIDKLSANGIEIDHVFQCFHTPENNCHCRKPNTGMVDNFIKENKLDLNNSFTIGDKKSDIEFGKKLKMNTIIIDPKLRKTYSIETNKSYIAKHLLSASMLIEHLNAA